MSKRNLGRIALLILLAVGIGTALYFRDALDAAAVEAWVEQAGLWAPFLFMLAYAVATIFFLPGVVFTIAGGALFGPVWGTLFNLVGATVGAVAAFLVARYIAGDWVRARTGQRLNALMEGVAAEGWRFVAFVRLVPLFPFNLLNYALGLTPIGLVHYSWATLVFMLPGAAAYTYVGYAGREALAGGENVIQHALLALGLLALVAFLPRIVKSIRRRTGSSEVPVDDGADP